MCFILSNQANQKFFSFQYKYSKKIARRYQNNHKIYEGDRKFSSSIITKLIFEDLQNISNDNISFFFANDDNFGLKYRNVIYGGVYNEPGQLPFILAHLVWVITRPKRRITIKDLVFLN